MRVKIRLFATLRIDRGKELLKDYPDGTTVTDLIDDIGIVEKDVAILLINGRDATLSQTLRDEDTISIFPPVGGG